jgi:hypothetical protein
VDAARSWPARLTALQWPNMKLAGAKLPYPA